MEPIEMDHIAVAVPSLAKTLAFLALLGLHPAGVEEIPRDGIRLAMVPIGRSRLEIMEPVDRGGPVGRFLERRGPGLHHIALEIGDLDAALDALERRGVRLVDRHPRPGAGGRRVAFIHPEGTGGPLVELTERKGGKAVES